MNEQIPSLETYLEARELDLIVCETCGTQFETTNTAELAFCPICRDERASEPLDGPHWTSLRKIQETHSTKFESDPNRKNIYYAHATPRFAIGQRAIIFVCEDGIWIWDCFAVLTGSLVSSLKALERESRKRVRGIVISHPHFYTTSMSWAAALDTKVMISTQDVEWYQRRNGTEAVSRLEALTSTNIDLSPEVSTIRVSGHFQGSRVLLHKPSSTLAVADSVGITPRRTCTFMWSYPNNVPLSQKEVQHIWDMLKEEEFECMLGGWMGEEIPSDGKVILRSSAVFWLRHAGWEEIGLTLR